MAGLVLAMLKLWVLLPEWLVMLIFQIGLHYSSPLYGFCCLIIPIQFPSCMLISGKRYPFCALSIKQNF
jgi:hypothetical protein